MFKAVKPVIANKSTTYSVAFGYTKLRTHISDLKEAITFAYQLHFTTLDTPHDISVWTENEFPHQIAQFLTESFFDKPLKDGDK